jgi:hypothetical protein
MSSTASLPDFSPLARLVADDHIAYAAVTVN